MKQVALKHIRKGSTEKIKGAFAHGIGKAQALTEANK